MHFESPVWFSLLALIPLLWLLAWAARRRAQSRLRELAAPELLPVLFGSVRWPGVLRLALCSAGIALAAAALARPALGYRLREVKSKESATILAIDVSDSMLCTDESPSRLTRAKLAARDILAAAKGQRMGLVLFAGEAFLECPLTQDAGALASAIDAAAPSSVPKKGTNLAKAIAEARAAFGSGDGAKTLVLFTDGEDLEGAGLREARAAKGMKIVTVGVGSREGAPVPEAGGTGYRRDDSGRVITSRPDFAALSAIAEASGGFSEAIGSPFLAEKIAALADGPGGAARESTVRIPLIRYRWPLAAALLFFAAEAFVPAARRKAAGLSVLVFLFLPLSPNGTLAASTEAPPENPRTAYNQGVALYEKGDYDKAADAFARAGGVAALPDDLRAKALGNAGTAKLAGALALLPKDENAAPDPQAAQRISTLLTGAKKNLEAALNLAPGDTRFKKNYDLAFAAEKELAKRKSPPQQNPQQNPQEKKDQKEGDSGDKQQNPGDGQNKESPSGKPQQDSAQNGAPQQGQSADKARSAQDSPSGQKQGQSGSSGEGQKRDGGAQQAGNTSQKAGGDKTSPQNSSGQPNKSGQTAEKRQPQPGGTPSGQEGAAGERGDRQPAGSAASNPKQEERGGQASPQAAPNARKDRETAQTATGKPGENGKEKDAGEKASAAANTESSPEGEKGEEKAALAKAGEKDAKASPEKDKILSAVRDDAKTATGDRHDAKSEEPSDEGDTPRTEGEHTAGLERTGAGSVTPGTNTAPQPPQTPAASGAMTPAQAEELLKILGTPDKLLPAGKTEKTTDNFSGRDW
jgi:Ca-activated chloride channel family protein